MTLPPIQMLWFGKPIGPIQALSISSFLRHGHDVHLYTYGNLAGVPDGTVLKDASEIIPQATFDAMRSTGVRPAIFADLFRYSLLWARGGWWVDSDIVCVGPFDHEADVVFGFQDERQINNAVLRFPAGHRAVESMLAGCRHPNRWRRVDTPLRCWQKSQSAVRGRLRGRRGLAAAVWGSTGPDLVTAVARRLGIDRLALPQTVFYPVAPNEFAQLVTPGVLKFGSDTRAVHLWNELVSRRALEPEPDSPLSRWFLDYGIAAG